MSLSALEKLEHQRKLTALSNVVLIHGCSGEFSKSQLEEKISQRIDKEFPDQRPREKAIIKEIKEKNLCFVERTIKQQRDGEYFVQIKENVREKDVHLFHKFGDKNLDFMELLVMGDTLKRAGVKSVTTYLPYIPYQRQDKKDEGRVPISGELVFKLLQSSFGSRLKRIVTFDLHASQAQAHFEGPLDELSAMAEFAAYYRDLKLDAIISPDAGAAKRGRYLAKLLGLQNHVLDKKRTGHGKAETRYILDFNVKGKKIGIVDDMIDSGSSVVGEYENKILGPVQYLQSKGALSVNLCCTHPIYSEKNGIKAEERLRRAGIEVLVTDSLPEKQAGYYEANKDWQKVISLNHALAKTFYCNQVGESISAFIQAREKRLMKDKLDFVMSSYKGVLDPNF